MAFWAVMQLWLAMVKTGIQQLQSRRQASDVQTLQPAICCPCFCKSAAELCRAALAAWTCSSVFAYQTNILTLRACCDRVTTTSCIVTPRSRRRLGRTACASGTSRCCAWPKNRVLWHISPTSGTPSLRAAETTGTVPLPPTCPISKVGQPRWLPALACLPAL